MTTVAVGCAYRLAVATVARPTSWRDWAVPAALLVWAQAEIWIPGLAFVRGPRVVFCGIAIACCLALLVRRTRPILAALAVCTLLLCPVPFGWYFRSTAQVLMLVVAVFACGRYAKRPAAYLAIPLGSLMVLIESIPDPDQTLAGSWSWSLNSVWIFALGAGFRHERILREQVASAAEARSQAAAVQERLKVARELHDILSHSRSVVVVQAEVADTFLDTDPVRSREAIRSVAATGRGALGDTRRLVSLLRDPDAEMPSSPRPGLDDIPALVDRIRGSGLPVSLDIDSCLPSLSAEGTVTAYRVVQEALTNVLRHAGRVPTRVGLQPSPGALVIDIRNEGNGLGPTPRRGGHGLLGMGERVRSCGGDMTSGPCQGGGFRVRAVLPARDSP